MIPIYVGYDDREAVGYSVFCSSVLSRTKERVAFHPMRGSKVVGSTQFNAERFRIAEERGFRGWAIWAESDMLCRGDVAELMELAKGHYDVLVAKHEYQTKFQTKFLGQPNPDYPRKNWSSLMLINCDASVWRRVQALRPPLTELHRFSQITDDKLLSRRAELFAPERVGALPLEWNWLVGEYAYNRAAKLAHFTIGLPCWQEYATCDYADEWFEERRAMLDYQQHIPLCA